MTGDSASKPVHFVDQDRRLGWAMLSPALLYIAGFIGVPFVLAILLSFSNATVGDPRITHLVGLANYVDLMDQPVFMTALKNSILITFLTLVVLLVLATMSVQYGLSHTPANRAIVILLTELVVAAISSWYWAGEEMTLREWLGGALIVAASVVSGKLEEKTDG